MNLKIIDYSGEIYYLEVNGKEFYIGDYKSSPADVASRVLKAIGFDYGLEKK